MDEKTEELRDIFMDVAEDGTVTESQTETHGTLAGDDEAEAAALLDVVAGLRERFELRSDGDDETLVAVVREFYAGSDDAAIAAATGLDEDAVVTARLDLHLFREDDAARAAAGALDPDHLERAREQARAVSYRFQSAYEDAIPDADLARSHVEGVHEDGLEEAAEDIETDVSF